MPVIRTPEGRYKSVLDAEDAQRELARMVNGMTPEELAVFQEALRDEQVHEGMKAGWFHRKPVSMEQFLEDPYYLGESTKTLFPAIRRDLIELFEGSYHEVIACLHPDTVIPLLDGTTATIKELADRWEKNQEKFWVYSIGEQGEVRPALAEHPRCTGHDDYYKVTVDDGTWFIANARHQMVMRNNTKKMVRDMKPGDSIMPFETKLSKKGQGRRINGYELILDPKTEKFVYTHAVSADFRYGLVNSQKQVIHHKNFRKLDNRPDNLELMGHCEHVRYHRQHRRELLDNNPEYRAYLSERTRKARNDPTSNYRKAFKEYSHSARGRRISAENLAKANITDAIRRERFAVASEVRWNGEKSQEQRSAASDRMTQRNLEGNSAYAGSFSFANRSEESKRAHIERIRIRNTTGPHARLDITVEKIRDAVSNGALTQCAAAIALGCSRTRIRRVLEDNGIDLYSIFPNKKNHHVISIEHIGHGPVYCMTVPGPTNFAILTTRKDGKIISSGLYSGNTGGIGVGKTTTFSFVLCRLIYELSCLRDAHGAFGLSRGSELVIPLISKNLPLSRRVLKSAVDDKLKLSPYFLREFTPKFTRDSTIFPGNLHMILASYNSDRILGTNVVGAVLDEANDPSSTKNKQVITRSYGERLTEAHFDVVEKVFTNIMTRIASRLLKAGGYTPGMVILTSSAGTVNSFIDRRIRDAKDRNDVFVRDHVAWTAKPKREFTGETFRVLCGTSSLQSRILTDEEEVDYKEIDKQNGMILEVPIEFKKLFEQNLEDALRDVLGVSTMAISPYIQRVEALESCIRYDKPHPFATEIWLANTPTTIQWSRLVKRLNRQVRPGVLEEEFQPLRNPSAPRWVHVDASVSGDSTGICVAHIAKWVEVERVSPDGKIFVELSPFYVIDFMLEIAPPPGEQIFLGDVRQIIMDFQAHGFYIMGMSADQYQSVEMRQQLTRNAGIRTYEQSVDRTTAPYDTLKAAIYEGRIEFYNYPPLFDELRALEYDRDKGKIDHPKAGKKDLGDSVAGAIFSLSQHISDMPLERRLMDTDDAVLTPQQQLQQHIFPDRIVGRVDPEEILQQQQARQDGHTFPVPFI